MFAISHKLSAIRLPLLAISHLLLIIADLQNELAECFILLQALLSSRSVAQGQNLVDDRFNPGALHKIQHLAKVFPVTEIRAEDF